MPVIDLGDWRLTTIDAGEVWLDGGSMFGSVPKPLWSRWHLPDARNRIRLAMRALLAEGHGRRVLIDVGAGGKMEPKLADIYGLDDGTRLERSLAAAGVAPGDVTDVVLTHLHFDHAGGATRRVDGRLEPRLPNARWWVQRRNLDNARHPNPRERASYLAENFEPLAEAAVLEIVEGAAEPWPGFHLDLAEGHTRGQQLPRIAGRLGTVQYAADLVPTAAHVRIPFVMGYDMAVIETMAEKRAWLERAIAHDAWVCLEHDPDIAFARPRAEGDDFAWAETVPAETAEIPARR
jgi:glyoxylase-like metal-dependent hydrolase (beta-lactamase superfamily II)